MVYTVGYAASARQHPPLRIGHIAVGQKSERGPTVYGFGVTKDQAVFDLMNADRGVKRDPKSVEIEEVWRGEREPA